MIEISPSVFIYWITIPSMYLLLMIYSVFNLNDVSWGTREDAPQKPSEEEVKKKAEAKQKKSSKWDWLTGVQFNRHFEFWAHNWVQNRATFWAKFRLGHSKFRHVSKLQT